MLVIGEKRPVKVVLRAAQGDDPEAFVTLAPITPGMRRRAQRAARGVIGEVADIAEVDEDLLFDAGDTASRELIRIGMIGWGGIGGEGGAPLELTPDAATRLRTANDPDRPTGTIDYLLADEDIVAAIDRDYVRPDAIRRLEKNASSASSNGTGEAATAASDTASSVASRRRKGGVQRARTGKTSSAATKPKASGSS